MPISVQIWASLNVNGLRQVAKQQLLNDFLRTYDIDICFLQEVNICNPDFLYGFDYETNLGPEGTGK